MKHIDNFLSEMERSGQLSSRHATYERLRRLGLGDFSSILWSMPDQRFPKVSQVLPRMASDDVQDSWTGSHGYVLLGQSLNFVRAISENYIKLTGQSLYQKKILDFGCGYGRFLRLGAYFSDQIYGVDPWSESVRICNEAGLVDRIYVSDYLPETLPVPNDMDLAFAFSVFTHLSERATLTCLRALHRHVATKGILCLTIRPVEYWRSVYPTWPEHKLVEKEREHATGFSFEPHLREAVDGDITYGDTSMTIEWLTRRCESIGWKIEAFDRSVDDPWQRYVFLRKV